MKKIIYLILISNFAFSQTANLDTNTILIGQQINLKITNEVSSTDIWPTYDKFLVDGIEIIRYSKIDTTDKIISQQLTLTAWDTGTFYIPPIAFSKNKKTEELLISVKTIPLKEGAILKDIKSPIDEPIGWSDIWPWLITILTLVLISLLIKKHLFNKKEIRKTIEPKVIIQPDIVALKELSKLEKAKIWQKGSIKEYHSKLSEIIRRYTENRFKLIALELTTDEILKEIKPILDKQLLNNLRILLQRADLAKFAKSKPIDTENTESMLLAKEFVTNTKEKRDNE
tara:strand:+ start:640 stop:1494 length:855 start_codon:yes stop_codon:yes gene_type:complete